MPGGRSYLICPLDRVVWHGNGFNGIDVGVELDGYYEGIEGNAARSGHRRRIPAGVGQYSQYQAGTFRLLGNC